MILTKAQRATLEKAQAVCNNVLPKLEYIEALAAQSPLLAERVAELRTRREYIYQLATSALDLDRQTS